MKNFVVFVCLFLSSWAIADDKQVLQQRLDKVQGFYAQFKQQVISSDNQILEEGNGELWVNRPNYFNWFVKVPDETRIISDGKSLWFYMPMIEQVTIMDLNQVVDNQLLLLITDSQSQAWQDYQIKRQQNVFTLTPVSHQGQQFIIHVLPTGMIADFTIIEEDGQKNYYELSHQQLGKVDKQKFSFIPPENILIDDQRTPPLE